MCNRELTSWQKKVLFAIQSGFIYYHTDCGIKYSLARHCSTNSRMFEITGWFVSILPVCACPLCLKLNPSARWHWVRGGYGIFQPGGWSYNQTNLDPLSNSVSEQPYEICHQQRHNAVTMATVKMSLKFFDYILIDLISNFFESTKELIVKSKPWLASWSDFLRYGYWPGCVYGTAVISS